MELKFPAILSMWIAWFGCLYAGFLICRLTVVKALGTRFIGLIELTDSNFFLKELGKAKATTFKLLFSISSFTILGIVLCIFVIHTNFHESEQLKRYGTLEKVVVKKVFFDKSGRHIYFEFDFNQNRYHKELHSEVYENGDTALIIFSYKNPNIVKLAKQ